MEDTKHQYMIETFSLQTAQKEFENLVKKFRDQALWFMNDNIILDIANSQAETILDHIAQKAPRSTWLTIRKLKRWRSLNFR